MTASVEPQIDMLGWLRYAVRKTVESHPMALGDPPNSSDAATAFLVNFHAVTTDILIGFTGGLLAAIPIHGAFLSVTPQSTILRWHFGALHPPML